MYLKVHVIPNSKKERIEKIKENSFKISVREPAERNLANNRIKQILAEEFNISTSGIRIISGHHSPSKMFSINKKC